MRGLDCGKVEGAIKTGNGQLVVSGKCDQASFSNTGVGSVQADNLEAGDVSCRFFGTGTTGVWATDRLTIKGMFPGKLYYKGNPGKVKNYSMGVKIFRMDADGKITDYQISEGNTYPRMYSGAGGAGAVGSIGNGRYNFYPQSRYLMNMSYLRLKNITFGYTLPVELTRKALIQKARIYFSADNVCFLHNGAGKYQLDPEMSTASGSSVQGYNDGNGTFGRTIPLQRTFSFGVQVTL